jgi:hypothetical protein
MAILLSCASVAKVSWSSVNQRCGVNALEIMAVVSSAFRALQCQGECADPPFEGRQPPNKHCVVNEWGGISSWRGSLWL